MNSFFRKLIKNYQVTIFDTTSLKNIVSFSVNKFFVGGFLFLFFIVCFCFSILILVFSPIGNQLFDYSKKNEISRLYFHVDSIERLLNKQLNYTESLKLILNNNSVENSDSIDQAVFLLKNLEKDMFKKDSSLVHYIKKLDSETVFEYNKKALEQLGVVSPLKGLITTYFNPEEGHLGIDVAAKKNTEIKAVLSGIVIFSGFSLDFGNFLIIKHPNDFFSIYFHCSSLLKNQGDFVQGGEIIALVGSSGKLSTAPHLHFELWYDEAPINPEKYIEFQ